MVTPVIGCGEKAISPSIDVELSPADMLCVLDSAIDENGLMTHCIDSFNEFLQKGMKQIITKQFSIETPPIEYKSREAKDQDIKTVMAKIEFTDADYRKPERTSYTDGAKLLLPREARLSDLNYTGAIIADATITLSGKKADGTEVPPRTKTISQHEIGKIPIMVRSCACHTHERCAADLIKCGEDTTDGGGSFIVKGTERAPETSESQTYNDIRIFAGKINKEVMRLEIISKPGDSFENSFRAVVRHLQNGAITVEIDTQEQKGLQIPFYIMYRLLGMSSDIDMVQTIIGEKCQTIDKPLVAREPRTTDALSAAIYKSIYHAIFVTDAMSPYGKEFETIKFEQNIEKISEFVMSLVLRQMDKNGKSKKDINMVQYNNQFLMKLLDTKFLPHCGDDRIKKCYKLGEMIHDMEMVRQGAALPTDRDTLIKKRMHTPGYAYSKEFKHVFNSTIIVNARKALRETLTSASFYQIKLEDMFISAIRGSLLEKAMSAAVKAVTTMKDSKAKLYINALERKNAINTLAALRVITTPNKNMAQQSDRAYAMRAVHPTFTGMICPNASVDTGQAVGLNKQLAIATIISSATDSSFVSEILLKDPLVVPLLKMQVELVQQANRVLVNGDTIGYTLDPNGLVLKYRMARRNGENGISRKMTIFWDTYIGKIYFFTDSGRMLRPLIVVKDNLGGGGGTDGTSDLAGVRGSMPRLDVTDLASLAKFRQTMALTKDDVRAITAGKGKFSDLEERGVVEYIDAQEQTNCVIAQDLQTFNAARGDIRRRFTHVQWPQTMLGLAILTAPIPNHSESSRCCYQTNHAKQACGWYALNWPSRIDKLTFFQFACENPLVTTIVNRHVQPNGANVIVAMMSFNGANMEDALIFNKSSALNGLFAGIAFHSEKSELEKDEEWGIPNTATTHEIKQHANYSKLQPSGYPAVGTLIRNGDVVIGKIQHIKQPTTQYTTIDKSVVYKKQEDAVVTCVYKDVNQDNNPFIKVKLETVRTVQNGDKYSSRSGNKGIVSCQLPSCDMPYGEKTGIRPDIIYNAHCMPKRMMINQQLEAVLAYINAKLGRIADQTAFMPIDINWIKKEAARAGIEYLGEERMINGMTGQTQEAMIFMTPLNIQHLKRFIVDSIYVANSGATSAITHQPVSGKKQGGSLKYGEMEKDVIFGHGAISMFCERFFTNSDGVDVPVCKTCGNRAIITGRGTARCTICRDRADIVFISSAWAVNGFLDSLNALGVKMNLTLDPHVIEN